MRRADSRLEGLAKSANRTARVLKGLFVGASVGAAIASIVRATSEAQRSFAQLEATVKSTGGVAGFAAPELAKMSQELQGVTTFADDAVQSMQAVLLTFTRVRGNEFRAAQEAVLDMATLLGTDLRSAAIQVGKALNDPVKGITSLSRAGVQFSDSQKQTINDLVSTGQVAAAQRVILKELEVQFGGSARAARNTFGGALTAVKNAFGDLLEGGAGVSAATTAFNDLAETLADPKVKAGFDSLASGMLQVVTAVVTLISKLGFLGPVLREIGELIRTVIPGGLTATEQLQTRLSELRSARASGAPFTTFDGRAVDAEERDRLIAQLQAQLGRRRRAERASAPGSGGNRGHVTQREPTPVEVETEIVDSLDRAQIAAAARQRALIDTVDQGVRELHEETIKDTSAALDDLKIEYIETTDELSVFSEQAFRNIQSSLAEFLFDPFQDGLDGMLKGFVDIVRRMIAEAAAAKLAETLFGKQSASGGRSGGLLGNVFGSVLGSLFGGTRDQGGRGQPGSIYEITPKVGSEFFVPDSAGSFVTRSMLGGRSGGAIYLTNNINVAAGAVVTRQEAIAIGRQSAEAAVAQLRDERRRRGQF